MPEDAWNSKDERQYEHVRKSERERGRTPERAREIAARTVNDQRRTEGRTENRTTSGTGNPNSSLEDRTTDQLMNRARELNIRGRSSMRKAELIDAIREQQN
ncbi:Rho termination factor N-terminal domain-containing protein [soil metagenome]